MVLPPYVNSPAQCGISQGIPQPLFFNLSHLVSLVTTTTILQLLKVVCVHALTATTTVTIAFSLFGLPIVLGRPHELPPSPLILVDIIGRCYWVHYCATAATSISCGSTLPVITQAYANYAMGAPQVSSHLSELRLPLIFYVVAMMCAFFFGFSCGHSLHKWGLNYMGLHHFNPLGHTYSRHMCLQVVVHGPYRSVLSSSLPHCFGLWMAQTAVSQLFKQYSGAYSFGGSAVT